MADKVYYAPDKLKADPASFDDWLQRTDAFLGNYSSRPEHVVRPADGYWMEVSGDGKTAQWVEYVYDSVGPHGALVRAKNIDGSPVTRVVVKRLSEDATPEIFGLTANE